MRQRKKIRTSIESAPNTSPSEKTPIRVEPAAAQGHNLWLIGLLPGLVAIIAFMPAVEYGFVDWDDFTNFTNNKAFRGLGGNQLRWAWTTFHLGVYQPLSWMLLELEYVLWGLDPRGFHLTTLALYAIAAVVLYALVVSLLVRCRCGSDAEPRWPIQLGSALAVTMFVAHPLRTEVVAWVSCQPYVPCALFSMLTVLAYLHAQPAGRPPRVGWMISAFFLFAAALLAKAVAVTLPVVLLILDIYPLRRIGAGSGGISDVVTSRTARWAWIEKVPYLVLSLIFMRLAVLAKRAFASQDIFLSLAPGEIKHDSLAVRIIEASYSVWFYLVKTFWPRALSPFYSPPPGIAWSNPRFLFLGLALAGLTLTLILIRSCRTWLLAAWVSYLVILAPNSGLVRIGSQLTADRYSYMAMTGLVVLTAAGLSRLMITRRRTTGIVAVGLVMVAGLTFLSRIQCRIWSNSIVLWKHVLAVSKTSDPFVYYALGEALFEAEDFEASLDPLGKALALDPGYILARRTIGISLLRTGRLAEAEPYLAEDARLRPKEASVRANYGELLLLQGRPADAEPELAEAVRLQPDEAGYRNNLGSALVRQGKLEKAADQFQKALAIQPESSDFRNNLGMVRARQEKLDEGVALFTEVLRTNPDHISARLNLAMALLQKGNLAEAESQFNEVLRRQPGVALARNALAEIARARQR